MSLHNEKIHTQNDLIRALSLSLRERDVGLLTLCSETVSGWIIDSETREVYESLIESVLEEIL
jgi:hypothetical protein